MTTRNFWIRLKFLRYFEIKMNKCYEQYCTQFQAKQTCMFFIQLYELNRTFRTTSCFSFQRREEELLAKQKELDNLTSRYSELDASERPADLERKMTRFKEKWSKVLTLLANRTKTLNNALESGPPRQYLDTMEGLTKLLKDTEERLSVEFQLTDTAKLEEQLAGVRVSSI